MRTFVVTVLCICASASAASAEDYLTRTPAGTINWTKGYISTSGSSRIAFNEDGEMTDAHGIQSTTLNRARTESYADAREKSVVQAIQIIRSIRIDHEHTFLDLLKNDRITQQRFADLLERSSRSKKYPGGFFSTVCETRIRLRDLVPALNFDFPAHALPERDDAVLATRYTGLIIDARGTDIMPMLFPSIYAEDGLEIYGRHHIDIRYASRRGLAAYCHNENEAVKNKRSGDRPYYTTALKSINQCPVLAERDVRKILASPATRDSLKKCRVIIILGKKKQ